MRGVSAIARGLVVPSMAGWILLALAPAAAAALCERPLRVAYFEFGMMSFVGRDGTVQGIDKDIADALAVRTGCRFEAIMQERAETWRDLATGKVDLALSAVETPERRGFAEFLPYVIARYLLIVRRPLAQPLHAPGDLATDPALRLGVVKGFRHGPLFEPVVERMRAAGRVREYDDVDALFAGLKAGEIDALFSVPVVFPRKLREMGLEFRVEVIDFDSSAAAIQGALAIATKSTTAAQRAALADALRAMIRDGTIKRIMLDRLGQLYSKWIAFPTY